MAADEIGKTEDDERQKHCCCWTIERRTGDWFCFGGFPNTGAALLGVSSISGGFTLQQSSDWKISTKSALTAKQHFWKWETYWGELVVYLCILIVENVQTFDTTHYDSDGWVHAYIVKFHVKACNTIVDHAIPLNTNEYCSIAKYHRVPCNTIEYHPIPS